MKKEALFYTRKNPDIVECILCSHRCTIKNGSFGICGVRENINGKLYTHAYGQVIANQIDPIEKKPLYHFLPGTRAYSVATIGCNFKCGFCQNWQISQSSFNDNKDQSARELSPEEIVNNAKESNSETIAYTYTEPTIFFEYALETAKIAKENELSNIFVTNGFMSKKAVDLIAPYLDACNVDLKSFKEETYQGICKARLKPVLESIKHMKALGIWVEITTLIVPGLNDSEDEINSIAEFIASVGVEIPWHISRFHPNYRYTDTPLTAISTLNAAKKIGKDAGLRYVYLGNVTENSNTYCYKCNQLLIERNYLYATQLHIESEHCPKCNTPIDGVFKF